MKSMIKNNLLLFGFLLTLLITLGIYSNHFNNPFFFDDSHTIVNNSAITSLENWTTFFTNPETFSSLPANRAYRPMVTFFNAIDYAISGELNPLTYHIHIFFWYIITVLFFLVLMTHLSKKANLVIGISKELSNDLSKFINRKVTNIYNPALDENIYKKRVDKIIIDKRILKKRIILNVGFFEMQKDQITILKAFNDLKKDISNIHLILIGKGSKLGYLKR